MDEERYVLSPDFLGDELRWLPADPGEPGLPPEVKRAVERLWDATCLGRLRGTRCYAHNPRAEEFGYDRELSRRRRAAFEALVWEIASWLEEVGA